MIVGNEELKEARDLAQALQGVIAHGPKGLTAQKPFDERLSNVGPTALALSLLAAEMRVMRLERALERRALQVPARVLEAFLAEIDLNTNTSYADRALEVAQEQLREELQEYAQRIEDEGDLDSRHIGEAQFKAGVIRSALSAVFGEPNER